MKKKGQTASPAMHFVRIADTRIVRPTDETTFRLRLEAHNHVLQAFPPARYTETKKVNAILQRAFEFYSVRLGRLLEQLASRDFIQCILLQYDESVRIGHGDTLVPIEREFWRASGPQFRRALKHLCEKASSVALRVDSDLTQARSVKFFNQALLCAEEMVNLYHLSETTYSLFPDDIELQLSERFFDCTLQASRAHLLSRFVKMVEDDRDNQSKFIKGLTFDTDPPAQCAVLDPYFYRAFGISFGHFLDFLRHAVDDPTPDPNGLPIPFINLERFVEAGSKLGIEPELVRKILMGFTLRKTAMRQEGRVMWNPKQKHRALRRAFFEFPHPEGTHLVWSRGMAKESFVWLLSGACFQQLPDEWINDETRVGLAAVSNACGEWFERVASDNLRNVGFKGQAYNGHVRVGQEVLAIPDSVGQLDFLGYNSAERLLLLAEFKMVEEGTEPRFYRDAIAQFVRNKVNYADKFRRKIAWVTENREHLAGMFLPGSGSVRLASVMITLYPCFASFFIDDFPCVSITHFRLDYQRKSGWPYPLTA
ncbi:MAG: hypothetical protein WCV00_07175 [Verrucomicrobiia bacterium]